MRRTGPRPIPYSSTPQPLVTPPMQRRLTEPDTSTDLPAQPNRNRAVSPSEIETTGAPRAIDPGFIFVLMQPPAAGSIPVDDAETDDVETASRAICCASLPAPEAMRRRPIVHVGPSHIDTCARSSDVRGTASARSSDTGCA